jgi:phosphoglycolate phosphatase-like HAD superfamily hydrolase
LEWSEAVNEAVRRIVRHVPPFPFVRESLERLKDHADILVVSATPQEALEREWEEHDLKKYVGAICGQEIGTKKQCLGHAAKGGGNPYPPGHVLMIGDAPGDYQAAKANGALFFPIIPGHEEASWERFYKEGIDRFLNGSFAGEYEEQLVAEFNRYLPDRPPWPVLPE